MKNIFNRPLTPHLTIYSSQFTSMYSIWHRITGLILIFIIVLFFFFLKINLFLIQGFTLKINLWFQNAFYLNFTLFICYHMFNGIRHIIWDLGFFLSIKVIQKSAKLLGFFLISYIIILLFKILN